MPATVVIECPHCRTRYQVPPDTLGPAGRKVQCAHCGKSWQAEAVAPGRMPKSRSGEGDRDQLFDPTEETRLDAELAAEADAVAPQPPPRRPLLADTEALPPEIQRSIEEIKAAIAPRPPELQLEPPVLEQSETPVQRKSRKAFSRRQLVLSRTLPLARVRRGLRVAGLAALLLLVGGGVVFRTEIVRAVPDLAGIYEALGLTVNVVGLRFADVTTLLSRKDGGTVMTVDATIHSVEGRAVAVPPVVITLLDAAGQALYAWSVNPDAADLRPGEAVNFTTQLSAPPPGATLVRLTFANGRASSETPIAKAVEAESPAQ